MAFVSWRRRCKQQRCCGINFRDLFLAQAVLQRHRVHARKALHRRHGLALHLLGDVMLLLASPLSRYGAGSGCCGWCLEVGSRSVSPRRQHSRQWQVQVHELEKLGLGPGLWVTADSFINFHTLLPWWRGRRQLVIPKGSMDFIVIFFSGRIL